MLNSEFPTDLCLKILARAVRGLHPVVPRWFVSAIFCCLVGTGCSPQNSSQLNWIDARDHGAVGDGKHDDTKALHKALQVALESRRYVVYLPPGRYRITKTLYLESGHSLLGDGIDVTTIVYEGKGAAVGMNGRAEHQIVKNTVRGLSLYGRTKDSVGLAMTFASYSRFDDLRIFGFRTAVKMENSWLNTLTAVIAEASSEHGFHLGLNANSNGFIHCTAVKNEQAGYYVEGARGATLLDCNSELNGINLLVSSRRQRPTEKFTVVGGYFEGAKQVGVKVESGDGESRPKAITLRDMYFVSLEPEAVAILIRACDTILVEGCHFSAVGEGFATAMKVERTNFIKNVVWGPGNLDESREIRTRLQQLP